MYNKKSVLEGIVFAIGSICLIAMVILFGFTEVQIPVGAYLIGWFLCIGAMKGIVGKIQQYSV